MQRKEKMTGGIQQSKRSQSTQLLHTGGLKKSCKCYLESGDVVQLVACLPSMDGVLGLILSMA